MFLWNHNVLIISLKNKQLNIEHILKIIKIVLDIGNYNISVGLHKS